MNKSGRSLAPLGCGARHRRAAMLWYVNSKKSSDTKDGRSLDSAFRRILHAIHVAEPDDTIVIVPGIYDQDLAKHIGAARAVHVSVAVAGSEIET